MSSKHKDRSYSDLAKIFINAQIEPYTIENIIGYCLAFQPVERKEWEQKVTDIVLKVVEELVISGHIEVVGNQVKTISVVELADYFLQPII